ncbi:MULTISPECIES: thioredoxin [Halorussus]|uniref:thioredoxin n=1 Tax=Halorussus TaxID=1070314 RepID=UPI000E210925|nr:MULTISPECIES: thioredoxin [Halorussus]NHN61244.1 thioredoxin [Halorussus sp. JP-T4]
MSEDELESIRKEKRDELLGDAGGESGETDESGTAADAPDEPIHVESVEQFSSVTTDYDVVLVDFYADWCGPCNMLEPIVASVAANTEAAVAKVDVDQHQGLASQYGVRGVPTLLLFAGGEQVEQLVGVQDESTLTDLIERHG